MKVLFTAKEKEYFTVAEMPVVREIIEDMKDGDLNSDITILSHIIASTGDVKVFESSATIAKNRRVWNAFSNNSRDIDIWIETTFFDKYYGFYMIGAYLTDIWKSDGNNAEELKSYMYIRRFKEDK